MAEAAAPAAQDDGGEEAPHPHPLDLMNLVDDVLVRIVLPFQSDNLLVHVALAALVHPRWWKLARTSPAYLADYLSRPGCRAPTLKWLSRNLPSAETTQMELGSDWLGHSSTGPIGNGAEEYRKSGADSMVSEYTDGAEMPALGAALVALPPSAYRSLRTIRLPIIAAEAEKWKEVMQFIGRTNVHELDLNVCWNMGDDGLTALAASLPRTLERLRCGAIGCGDAGIAALAAALPATAIKSICIGLNEMTVAGWASLGAALPNLPSLREIDFGCDLAEDGSTDLTRDELRALIRFLPDASPGMAEGTLIFDTGGAALQNQDDYQLLDDLKPRCPDLKYRRS